MTQEKKAKAYDKALNIAREILDHTSENYLCTHLTKEDIKDMYIRFFPELQESEDEKVRKWLIGYFHQYKEDGIEKYANGLKVESIIAWLEKQGEQKPTQEIEPFEAEHGKYYYCIKDYFCGGRKQASKGDVVQALRGLPIMGLKDAGEYFLPVNSIKCNSAWSEEDEKTLNSILNDLSQDVIPDDEDIQWLKSLKERMKGE